MGKVRKACVAKIRSYSLLICEACQLTLGHRFQAVSWDCMPQPKLGQSTSEALAIPKLAEDGMWLEGLAGARNPFASLGGKLRT